MGDLHFLYALKVITVILKLIIVFLPHTHNTQIPLSNTQIHNTQIHNTQIPLSWILFFNALALSQDFILKSNSHSEDLFLILRNTSFRNWFYIWTITSLKSATGQHGHNSFFLSRLFLLLNIWELIKIKIYVTEPPKQNFYFVPTP